MSSVLILGGTGFVGQNLIPFLGKCGWKKLTIVDPLPPGKIFESIFKDGAFQADYHSSLSEIKAYDTEYVVCLASATNVDAALSSPEAAHRINIGLAIDLCEWLLTPKIFDPNSPR